MRRGAAGSRRTTAADGFELVARVDDVPEGCLVGVVKANGDRICLLNFRGEIGAVADNCTHQDFPMSEGTLLPNGRIECAWHGTVFDCRTGAVKHPPATERLPVFAVRIVDGHVYVGDRQS